MNALATPLALAALAAHAALAVPATADDAGGGYLFVTFKGEQTPLSEQVHFALSRDGRTWEALNGGEPVLVSNVGEKGVRDPFLVRSPDGAGFVLIATDLSIHRNGDWHRAQTAGSRSIVVWQSPDLVEWSPPRLVRVAAADAGCTWAPEAVYDEEQRDYLVFWASKNRRDGFAKQRIWAARTRDFRSFGEPFIYIDRPNHVIDTTIVRDGRRFYRFSKDEQVKAITMEVADRLGGPWAEVPGFSLAKLTGYEGPECYRLQPGPDGKPGAWCLLLDHYSRGAGYQPFVADDLASGHFVAGPGFSFPFRLRHGSILPLSAAEHRRLQQALAGPAGAPGREPPPAVLPGANADPHLAVFGDTFHLYPTSDGSEGWRSTSFRAWSSRDLVQWHDDGVILDLPRDLRWAKLHAWAPAIAAANGRFYFYFSAAQNIGVAVADSPRGPFRDPLGKPLVAKDAFPRMQAIDPMVFVDDDGAAYLYWGQGRCMAVRLNEDMTSFDPSAVRDLTPPGYNEGPFVHKRHGTYHLTWSEFDTRDPRYSVACATGNGPLGPFTKAPANPILRQNGPVKGAGHHSIARLPGRDEWVIAYHRFRIPNGNGYNRETCLSPLRHAPDGSILPVDVFETVPPAPTPAR